MTDDQQTLFGRVGKQRGWAAGKQRGRGKATEKFFETMGALMHNAGIALVVKAESVWQPVMGTNAAGKRAITGAHPSKAQAGIPDYFAVLGNAGGGKGIFIEAKECSSRRFRVSDPVLIRPAQRAWMDRVSCAPPWVGQMAAPCFLLVRFPKADRIYRLPWLVARSLDVLDSQDPAMDEYLVGHYYLEGLLV